MELSEDRQREILRGGDVDVLGRMPWSSNATFLVNLSDGDDEMLAIYKPQRGERPLWDFARGTLCHREVAAFEVSEALGWDIVPDTVLRDGPAGVGMHEETHLGAVRLLAGADRRLLSVDQLLDRLHQRVAARRGGQR